MTMKLSANLLLKLTTLLAIAALTACAQSTICANADKSLTIKANNPQIQYSGRTEGAGTSEVVLGYSGARVRLRFSGTSVGMKMTANANENYAAVWIDGKFVNKIRLNANDGFYKLAEGLAQGEHTVEVVRVTECTFDLIRFGGFVLNDGAKVLPWQNSNSRKIEFIGDSITCGYGVEADNENMHFEAPTENFTLAYSGLVARKLDADYLVVSRSGIGIVRNYDGPYEGSDNTMPELYLNVFNNRPDTKWDFNRFTPDLVCINLGTNDFSTSGVNVDKFVANYVKFGKLILTNYPKAKLLVLQGPMDNRDDLKDALALVVTQLNEFAPNRVSYFELGAQGSVGYGADYHPNVAQSQINADELSKHVATLMDWGQE